MGWLFGEPVKKMRKALAKAQTTDQIRDAVQPLITLTPYYAISELMNLMVDFPAASETLTEIAQVYVEGKPELASWQRIQVSFSASDARSLLVRHERTWGVAAILTMHPNGFIREEALMQIADVPEAFTFILNRRSDWVVEVAATAERLIAARGGDGIPTDVRGWRQAFAGSRRSRGPGRAYLERLLSNPESRLAGVAADAGVARLVLRPIPELGGDDPLVGAGLSNPDVVVRTMVAQRLQPGPRAFTWAARLLADSAPGVRIAGILLLAKDDPRHPLVGQARLDKNGRVRAQARITWGADDHLGFYRAALPHPSAIEGIGETGKRVDAQEVLPFLSHAQTRFRLAAVKALASLDARETVPALKSMLGDPSPRVIREVVRALDGLNATVQPEDLFPCLALPDRPMRTLLGASRLMSFWNGISFLLHYGGGVEFREWTETRILAKTPRMSLRDLEELEKLVRAEWGDCSFIGRIEGLRRRKPGAPLG